MLDSIRALGAHADSRAAEIEQLRRLPDDVVAELVQIGFFRQCVPAEYGGLEVHLQQFVDAVEELAFFDGSTAWCGMIGATTALCAGYLPKQWAEEMFGDPAAVAGGFALPAGQARPVEGGLVVNGRWQWGSGTYGCTWIGAGCWVVDDDGQRRPRPDGLAAPFVFFTRDQVELLDTWRVAGLKGTGSTDYAVHDAFVPEGRWVQIGAGDPTSAGPLYRLPFLGTLALGVSAVTLGLARRAVHELIVLAGAKRPAQSDRTLAERAPIQADVARAEAAYRSARAFIAEAIGQAWTAAAAGDPLTDEHRRGIRLAAVDGAWRAAGAVDRMYHAGGGSSIHESSPLQRVFRDVHVATQHGMIAERMYELTGRMALGLPTDTRQL